MLQLLDLGRIGLAVDFVELPGLGLCLARTVRTQLHEFAARIPMDIQNRVNDQMDSNLRTTEDDPQRVDQEWRIVCDEHDEGVGRFETVVRALRIEYEYQR